MVRLLLQHGADRSARAFKKRINDDVGPTALELSRSRGGSHANITALLENFGRDRVMR